MLLNYIQNLKTNPVPTVQRGEGQGVVIVGGGPYEFSALVVVTMLRRLGTRLPVEVWHLPWETPQYKPFFDELEASLLTIENGGWVGFAGSTLGGWEFKPRALLESRFEDILFLDADCYPVVSAEEILSDPEYSRTGAIFFPDPQGANLSKEQFELFGLPYVPNTPMWESGQFLVSKRKHLEYLLTVDYVNRFSRIVYKHVYGDKETFNLVSKLLRTPITLSRFPARIFPGLLHYSPSGKPWFVHRTLDKPRLRNEAFRATPQISVTNLYCTDCPLEDVFQEVLAECRKKVLKL
jgi:alpha 1,2-mannosyltransferase